MAPTSRYFDIMPTVNGVAMAWAAGLFEGEGCFSPTTNNGRKYPRAQVAVADEDVMCRFAGLFDFGFLRLERRQSPALDLWRWSVYQRDDVETFYDAVAPYLCGRRTARYAQMLAESSPRRWSGTRHRKVDAMPPRSFATPDLSGLTDPLHAWAVGLFEAEGLFFALRSSARTTVYPRAGISTTDEDVMTRFQEFALCGHVRVALRPPPRKVLFRWEVQARHEFDAFAPLIVPHVSARIRTAYDAVLAQATPRKRPLGIVHHSRT